MDLVKRIKTAASLRSTGWRDWVELAPVAVLVLAAAHVAFTALRAMPALALRTPFWDQWQDIVPEKFLEHPFAQHNEHRIFVGRLFLAFDHELFGGQGWFCLLSIVAMLIGIAAMLGWAAGRGAPRVGIAVFGLGVTLLLSLYSWENLLWPFQVSLVAVVPAAFVASIALTRQTPVSGNVAILAAAAATYSAANGILVAPLLVVLAALLGRPRREIIVLSLITVGLFASYLVGFDNVEHRTPLSAIRDPRLFFRYLSAFMGAPLSWGFKNRVLASQIAGAVGLAAWLLVSMHAFRKRRSLSPSDWVLPFAMSFVVASGALTAVGRMYYSVDQALAFRYGTIVFSFWTALIAQILRLAPPFVLRLGALVVPCALAIKVASLQEYFVTFAQNALDGQRHAETALAADALDVEAINLITPSPWLVKDNLPVMKERHWSIFNEPWAGWLGTKLSDHVRARDDKGCIGLVEGAQAVSSYMKPAYRLHGWAYSLRDAKPAERVFFVDDKGIVLGFGRVGDRRVDIKKARRRVKSTRTGFTGHVGRLRQDTVVVRAVALIKAGRALCRLPKDVTLVREEGEKLVKELK